MPATSSSLCVLCFQIRSEKNALCKPYKSQIGHVQPYSPSWNDVKLASTTYTMLIFFKLFNKKLMLWTLCAQSSIILYTFSLPVCQQCDIKSTINLLRLKAFWHSHRLRKTYSSEYPTKRKDRRAYSDRYSMKRDWKSSAAAGTPQEEWERPVATSILKRWNKKSSKRGIWEWICYKAWKQATWWAKLQTTISVKQAVPKKYKKKLCIKQTPELKYQVSLQA